MQVFSGFSHLEDAIKKVTITPFQVQESHTLKTFFLTSIFSCRSSTKAFSAISAQLIAA